MAISVGILMMAATPSTYIKMAITTNVSVVTALTAVTHQTSHPGDSPSDHFVDIIFQNRFDDLPPFFLAFAEDPY
jgi:hypothetical protein